LRKASLLLLGEDDAPVHDHVELTPTSRRDPGLGVECLGDLGRETRGPLVVAASGRAEEDLDDHGRTLVRWS
jgi:hypothetical protein